MNTKFAQIRAETLMLSKLAKKDPEYRLSQSKAERAVLLEDPGGLMKLTDADLGPGIGGFGFDIGWLFGVERTTRRSHHKCCPNIVVDVTCPGKRRPMKAPNVLLKLGLAMLVGAPAHAMTISHPGTYTLTRDYVGENIIIEVGGVTLDCAGHIIKGNANISSAADRDTTRNGIWVRHPSVARNPLPANSGSWWAIGSITVKNCIVYGWNAGIKGDMLSPITLLNNTTNYNGDGIDLNYVYQSLVSGGDSSWNAAEGIDLDVVSWTTITNVWIYANGKHGIGLNNYDRGCGTNPNWDCNYGNNFSNNTVLYTKGAGMNLKASYGGTFNNNEIAYSCQDLLKTNNICYENNSISGNSLTPAAAYHPENGWCY